MERIADRTEAATERTARVDTAMGLGFINVQQLPRVDWSIRVPTR